MQPGDISSAQHLNPEYIESLADTLEDYGLQRSEVRALPPALLNFMYYQASELEDFEQELLSLHQLNQKQEKTLKRVRSQRNALRDQIDYLRKGLESVNTDAFSGDQLPAFSG